MTQKQLIFTIPFLFWAFSKSFSCSIVYYVDSLTGKIYAEAYIQFIPGSKNELARIWYGWKKFTQGGINSVGLFFDGAATPKQKIPDGFNNPDGRNIGDEILARCNTVNETISYLDQEKIAVSDGHILFGDSTGNAAVIEWIHGEKR